MIFGAICLGSGIVLYNVPIHSIDVLPSLCIVSQPHTCRHILEEKERDEWWLQDSVHVCINFTAAYILTAFSSRAELVCWLLVMTFVLELHS